MALPFGAEWGDRGLPTVHLAAESLVLFNAKGYIISGGRIIQISHVRNKFGFLNHHGIHRPFFKSKDRLFTLIFTR